MHHICLWYNNFKLLRFLKFNWQPSKTWFSGHVSRLDFPLFYILNYKSRSFDLLNRIFENIFSGIVIFFIIYNLLI